MRLRRLGIVVASFLTATLLGSGSAHAIPVQININQVAQGGFGTQPATAGSLSQLSPSLVSYAINSDFKFFVSGAVLGNVTGFVDSVIGIGTDGCSAADFAGFTAGSIALVANTTASCLFSDQVNFAAAAGASGALVVPAFGGSVFDPGTNYGLADPVSIPSLILSNAVAADIQRVSAVPEPGTLGLVGAGLFGLGLIRRRARLPKTRHPASLL